MMSATSPLNIRPFPLSGSLGYPFQGESLSLKDLSDFFHFLSDFFLFLCHFFSFLHHHHIFHTHTKHKSITATFSSFSWCIYNGHKMFDTFLILPFSWYFFSYLIASISDSSFLSYPSTFFLFLSFFLLTSRSREKERERDENLNDCNNNRNLYLSIRSECKLRIWEGEEKEKKKGKKRKRRRKRKKRGFVVWVFTPWTGIVLLETNYDLSSDVSFWTW